VPSSHSSLRLGRTVAAGLAFGVAGLTLAACGGDSPSATPAITPGTSGAPREVNVILDDYVFVPGIVDLVPGETVTLNVVNAGLDIHELVLGPQAVQDAWAAAHDAVASGPPGPTPILAVPAGLEGLRVVVRSGETQTTRYEVPDDITEQLLLGCHIADHLERGMVGAVRFVEPGGVPLDRRGAPSGPARSEAAVAAEPVRRWYAR
jgi:hypothetical protein